MMALISKHTTKPRAEEMLGEKISRYEWRHAKMHALYPGAMKPVEVIKYSRSRFNTDALVNFLGYLDGNHLQNHAYGDKDYKAANGASIQLDAVSTTATASKILKDYAAKFKTSPSSSQNESKCGKKNHLTDLCCCLPKSHEGQCSFTSKEMLSHCSVKRILAGLTKGALKSKAGLDDEDVLKGSNSIERLVEIFEELAPTVGLTKEECKTMKARIDKILQYHKTGFVLHLKKEAERSCQCISCGLHSDTEPVPCQYRECSASACAECEESFQVFSELVQLAKQAQSKYQSQAPTERTPPESRIAAIVPTPPAAAPSVTAAASTAIPGLTTPQEVRVSAAMPVPPTAVTGSNAATPTAPPGLSAKGGGRCILRGRDGATSRVACCRCGAGAYAACSFWYRYAG